MCIREKKLPAHFLRYMGSTLATYVVYRKFIVQQQMICKAEHCYQNKFLNHRSLL